MDRWLVCAAFVACFIIGCSNDSGPPGLGGNSGSGGTGGIGGGTLSCEALTDPPDGCGEACGRDSDCSMGLFCASSVCLAECTAADPCGPTQVCSDRGRCENTLPDGGGGTGGSGCIDEDAGPNRETPNVMFLVDRSGSMLWLLDGLRSGQDGFDERRAMGELNRWEIAHDAIESVMTELDSIVRFGLATYHWNDDEYTGGMGDPECPILNTVDFGDNNASTILASYPFEFPPDPQGGSNDTPTGDSIDSLVASIVASPPPADGPTIIALATDGEPDTCEEPDPQNGQEEAITAATSAYSTTGSDGGPIQTFILSVGSDVSTSHLQEMANVGVGKDRDESVDPADFWVGTSPQELEDAFREIVTRNIVCDITLSRTIANASQACSQGDVQLDGTPLSCPTDWQVTGPQSIELLGTACDQWKSAMATNLSVIFPCGILVPQ